MQVEQRAAVLVFAGVDPSGGAGIAADVQAIAAQGAHALTVVTALTAQDNDRVAEVWPVEPAVLLRQAAVLTAKIAIGAVKIGIPGSAANARAIAEVIAALRVQRPDLPVVLDPVLASGHGDTLSRDDAVQALAPLLPLVTLLTPNGPEARALARADDADNANNANNANNADNPDNADDPEAQAASLLARGCGHVLITGGHGDGGDVVNRWFGPDARRAWRWERLPGGFHGSGCTLASAVAGLLAQGVAMEQALEQAQRYTWSALQAAYAVAPGQFIPRR